MTKIHLDRRVLCSFLIGMFIINAVVLGVSWNEIMAGKNDFPVFYANAQMVREGQASRMYDFDAESSFVLRVSSVTRPPNIHFPCENLIFLPFVYFRFGVAFVLWTLFSLGMLVGVALLMSGSGPGRSSFSLTLLALLAFFPVWYCLLQGQDSILLLFLFTLSFWFWRRGSDDAAGAVLAIGLFRPQLVLPFVVVSFLGGRWKFVRGFVPAAALAVALSVWVVGLHGMADYARVVMSLGTQGSASALIEQWRVHPGLMPTLRGLLWIIMPSSMAGNVLNLLLLFGALGTFLWAARRVRSSKDVAACDLAFGTAVGAVTLVSFHSLVHDFSLIILPLLIAAGLLGSPARVTKKSAYAIVTIAFVFFFTPFYILLLSTDKVGLFVLPAVAALWLMTKWEPLTLLGFAADHPVPSPGLLETV
jgi:hypothetical protein